MRRSYCLLSAAVLLALGVIGLAVPTRDPAPPAVIDAPAAGPGPQPPEPVEIVLKRGETLEMALRRIGVGTARPITPRASRTAADRRQ
jgi:hypothetical protein